MENKRTLTISVRHSPESGKYNVSDVDVGPLISGLTEEPGRLARGSNEDGTIRLSVERVHEWEYLIGLAIAGAAAAGSTFAISVMNTLGKRVGNWIADWCEKKLVDEPVEVRNDKGASVTVDPADLAASREELTRMLDDAGKREATVLILLPW